MKGGLAQGRGYGGRPGGQAAGGEALPGTDLELGKVRPPWCRMVKTNGALVQG